MNRCIRIFAYGSNMSSARLRRRVPSASPLAVACLDGHTLRIHKRGRDGSAKANVVAAANDCVWGVVYEIAACEKPGLDAAEGLGSGYHERVVRVRAADGTDHEAWMYVAAPAAIDDSVRPFTWYKRYVVAGAREHGLPAAYVARLERIAALPDPDRERETANRVD